MSSTAESVRSTSSQAPHSILVVEDESIVAMDIQNQLEDMGYRVVGTAGTGEEAMSLAREHEPDLVLMDIVLRGEMNGIEAARYVAHTLHVPVIFLTAFNDAQTVQRAAETGPYGYLTKPFSPKELRAAIEVAIYKSRVERRLRESERWFASTLRCVGEGVIATGPDARITFMNPAAEKITGWTQEDAAGKPESEVLRFVSDSKDKPFPGSARRALDGNLVVGVEHALRLVDRAGSEVPVDESTAPIRSDEGGLLGAVIVLHDARERIRHENRLRASEERFHSAFAHAPVGMALVSLEGEFLQVNKALCELLGYSEDELAGMRHKQLVHRDDLDAEEYNIHQLESGTLPSVQFEKRYLHREKGRVIWSLTNISLLYEGGYPVCFLYQIFDLTQRKESEYALARLAYFDTLTGLANRSRLRDELDRLLAFARRHRQSFAVVFMDLDRFKDINDGLGHEAGDDLLKTVAERLAECLRETDCVARMGGDEFVILLDDIRDGARIVQILEKMRLSISEPIIIAGRELNVTASMGISTFPNDGEDAQTLLRHADSALYAAKAEGRNRFHFFRPELAQRADKRLSLQSALRQALEREEFEVYYQPITSLADGTIHGFEALLRWRHNGEMVPPATFIPVAEETGLIEAIGAWVLNESCRFAATWPTPCFLSVNCSAHQFRENAFTEELAEAIKKSGLEASRLCLEITESVMMGGGEEQLRRLTNIRDVGVSLSIDDYGTGYSSLAYIKGFGARSLKIDSLFVRDLGVDANDAAIVSATTVMAHSLGLQVVAEGVETEAQIRMLRDYGCDLAQGYYFSRPVPKEQVLELIKAGRFRIPV